MDHIPACWNEETLRKLITDNTPCTELDKFTRRGRGRAEASWRMRATTPPHIDSQFFHALHPTGDKVLELWLLPVERPIEDRKVKTKRIGDTRTWNLPDPKVEFKTEEVHKAVVRPAGADGMNVDQSGEGAANDGEDSSGKAMPRRAPGARLSFEQFQRDCAVTTPKEEATVCSPW